jgi:hypothetical protein
MIFVIIITLLLVAAYLLDELIWRTKRVDRLRDIVKDPRAWRLHADALGELRRRRADISGHVRHLLPLLSAKTKSERVSAHSCIRKFFPDVASEIQDYKPSADAGVCRETVAPLLEKYKGVRSVGL